MGFDPISVASLGVGAVGGLLSGNATDDAAKAQEQASQQAVTDATNLVAKQKADRANTLNLTSAFNSLASYRAGNQGSGSTQFNPASKGA